MTLAAAEKATDHMLRWLGLVVAVLTLITLWESHRLHALELQEKMEGRL